MVVNNQKKKKLGKQNYYNYCNNMSVRNQSLDIDLVPFIKVCFFIQAGT